MSETHSELSDLFDLGEPAIPEPTEPEITPCTCGLTAGMYNMGQFHMRQGQVVGRCHEYGDLAAAMKRGAAALQGADTFSPQSQSLERRMVEIHDRIDELKRGGVNR